MTKTSLLTYTAAASLAAFLISLLTFDDTMVSCAILATTMATLIMLHDYSPRSYFVVTTSRVPNNPARAQASPFSPMIGSLRRKTAKRSPSVVR